MRFLAFLIIASVILSIARALTLVLVLIIVVSLIWAVITRPLELTGFMILMACSQLISSSPIATIIALTILAIVFIGSRPKSSDLDAGREDWDDGKLGNVDF